MKNPFVYGKPVDGENFVGRTEELNAAYQLITEKQNLVLHAPTGWGKTSFGKSLLEYFHGKDHSINIYLSLHGITTREKLTEQLANACAQALVTKTSEVMRIVETCIPTVKPDVIFEGSEPTQFSLDFYQSRRNLENTIKGLLDFPFRIAEEKGKKVVCVLDDYNESKQLEIEWINQYLLEKEPRSDVNFVFIVSDKNYVKANFHNNGNLNFAEFSLKKIDEQAFRRHLKNRFNKFNIEIKDDLVQRILNLTKNEPFYVQLLCHYIFDLALERHGGVATPEIFENAVDKAIMHQSFAYRIIWDSLSGTQRKVISGLARSIGLQVYSAGFMNRHEIASPSSAQTALKYLVSRHFVRREGGSYAITNPLMEEWLRRTTF